MSQWVFQQTPHCSMSLYDNIRKYGVQMVKIHSCFFDNCCQIQGSRYGIWPRGRGQQFMARISDITFCCCLATIASTLVISCHQIRPRNVRTIIPHCSAAAELSSFLKHFSFVKGTRTENILSYCLVATTTEKVVVLNIRSQELEVYKLKCSTSSSAKKKTPTSHTNLVYFCRVITRSLTH